jgi:hypothetical protein
MYVTSLLIIYTNTCVTERADKALMTGWLSVCTVWIFKYYGYITKFKIDDPGGLRTESISFKDGTETYK